MHVPEPGRYANDSFYRTFKVLPPETEGRLIFEIGNRQWDIPRLRQLLENVLLTDQHFQDFEVEQDFPEIGRRTMLLNARRLTRGKGNHDLILLAIEDVTERTPRHVFGHRFAIEGILAVGCSRHDVSPPRVCELVRHADAGYEDAERVARERGIKRP